MALSMLPPNRNIPDELCKASGVPVSSTQPHPDQLDQDERQKRAWRFRTWLKRRAHRR